MPRNNSESRKVSRRTQAMLTVKRDPYAQLAVLDERLGTNIGATRERAQLTALLPPSSEEIR